MQLELNEDTRPLVMSAVEMKIKALERTIKSEPNEAIATFRRADLVKLRGIYDALHSYKFDFGGPKDATKQQKTG